MGRELCALGARLVWDCALLQRKPINHQPDRRSWEAVPLLRTVRPPLLKTLPEWGLCIYLGGVSVLFFLLFFFLIFFPFPSVSLAKPTAGFGVFLFCYASRWVGRQSLTIQTDPPHPSPGYSVASGAWRDRASPPPFLHARRVRGSAASCARPLLPLSLPDAEAEARLTPGKRLLRQQPKPGSVSWGSPGTFLAADEKPAE